MDDFRRATTHYCGVGGWNCECCGPSRGDMSKERFRRWGRRRLKEQDRQELQVELAEPHPMG